MGTKDSVAIAWCDNGMVDGKFMQLDELGITFHKKPYNIAPGWIAVHGDHTPIKSQGGLSALEASRRHGKSVISGHTHRAGRSSFSEASGGRIGRVLHGVEVGRNTTSPRQF